MSRVHPIRDSPGKDDSKVCLRRFSFARRKKKQNKEKHEIIDEMPPQHRFSPLQKYQSSPRWGSLSQSLVLGHRTQQELNYTHGQRHKPSSNMLWTLKSKASLTMELRPGSGTPFPEPVLSPFSQEQRIPSVTDSELTSVQCACL